MKRANNEFNQKLEAARQTDRERRRAIHAHLFFNVFRHVESASFVGPGIFNIRYISRVMQLQHRELKCATHSNPKPKHSTIRSDADADAKAHDDDDECNYVAIQQWTVTSKCFFEM